MKHDECTHPKTPAGRAACRKAGGPKGAAVMHTEAPTVLRELLTLEEPVKAYDPAPRVKVARRDERNPDLIDCVARLKKFAELRVWDAQIHLCWDRGWKVRNDGDVDMGRMIIDGAKGQIVIMWARTGDHKGKSAFTFRPWDTSISRRVASVAIAFSLAEGR